MVYTPVLFVFSAIFIRCGGLKTRKIGHWFAKQVEGTFFNTILATIDALFIVMTFASMINIQNEEKAGGHDFSYYLSIVCFAIFTL